MIEVKYIYYDFLKLSIRSFVAQNPEGSIVPCFFCTKSLQVPLALSLYCLVISPSAKTHHWHWLKCSENLLMCWNYLCPTWDAQSRVIPEIRSLSGSQLCILFGGEALRYASGSRVHNWLLTMKFGERLTSGTEGILRISSVEIDCLPSQLRIRNEHMIWAYADLYIDVYHCWG